MTKHERLIRICREVLFGQDSGLQEVLSVTAGELDELCNYASSHGLLAVVASVLGKISTAGMNTTDLADSKLAWFLSAQDVIKDSQRIQKQTSDLARLFQEKGMDVMFLKGASLAQFYPSPDWRNCSDIDFFLYGRQDEGIDVLRQAGLKVRDTDDYHAHANFNGARIELHQQFLDEGRLSSNSLVESALMELSEQEGRKVPFQRLGDDVQNAYSMSPTMNAIFLMRHMTVHFVSEVIIMRQLYDWGLFLAHQGRMVDWDRVSALYEQTGMTEFARRIQHVVTIKMQMPVDACCPITPLGGPLTERMWHGICQAEEDGRKHPSKLLTGIKRRMEMLRSKWKYKLAYPRDSFWKMWGYMAVRGFKTISRHHTAKV